LHALYLFLDGFGEPFVWTFGCGLPGLELAGLPYQLPRQLVYDFAPWRRLLIRDDQLIIGTLVNVIFLGLALCNHGETNKKGETKCKIQS
jgi:hypothetical protein